MNYLRLQRASGAALAAALLTACSHEPAAPGAAFERPPAPVTVVQAVAEDVPLYLDEIGRMSAPEVVSVLPQISGLITELHFADGADLAAGAPLFTIDPRPFQAALDAATAALAESRAAREWARIEFERVGRLVETRAISAADYDARKNAFDVAEAKVQRDQAALDLATLDFEYTVVRSPIAGRAGERLVDLGNVVNANETQLVVIQRLDPLHADFTVPENELGRVQRAMAGAALAVQVSLPDEPDSERTGELTFLDNAVHADAGTVKLRGTIANDDRRFWPGRFVRVRLVLETLREAVLIPAEAPQLSADGTFVYVAKEDATAELRPVTLGQRQGARVVVSEGLASGEKVVVTGHIAVMPGGKIQVVESAEAAAAPASAPGEPATAAPASGSSARGGSQ